MAIKPGDRGHVAEHNTIDTRLDALEALPPGTSDSAVAGFVATGPETTAALDAATAALVPDSGTATGAALSATIATRGERIPSGARIGHRGSVYQAPENTYAAMSVAARAGYKYVEFDPRVTSDGVAVIMHDDTVDRMTDGTGTVAGLTAAQIATLHIDSGNMLASYPGEPVPLFDSMLKLLQQLDLTPVVDCGKVTDAPALAVIKSVVYANGFDTRATFLAVSTNVTVIRADYPKASVWLWFDLAVGTIQSAIGLAQANGCDAICIEKASLTPDVCLSIRQAGLRINTYPINASAEYEKFSALGVDLFTTEGGAW